MAVKKLIKTPKNKWGDLQKMIKPVGEIKDPLTALFYGKAGTGKTVLGSTFPKKLLILDVKERGTESIARTPGIDVAQITDWDKIEEFYWFLKSGESGYSSIMLDHLSNMQVLAMSKAREVLGMKPDDVFSQRSWGKVSGMLMEWIINFRDLRDIGMNVIMVAHDRQQSGEENEDNQIDPSIGPRLMPSVASFVNGAVSVIGSTFIRETWVKGEKGKKIRKVDYCLRVGPHGSYVTKIRKPIQSENPVPDIIVNPTYDKLIAVVRGQLVNPVRKPIKK